MSSKFVFLLVHGFGGSSCWWDAQRPCLVKWGRVVAADLPGHGGKLWQGETLEGMADQVFDSLSLGPDEHVIGIGSSFGGLVLLKIMAKHPVAFKKLVLVGSVPKFTASEDFPAGLTLEKIDKLALQLQGDRAAVMNMFFRSLFTRDERLLADHGRVKDLYQGTPVPSRETLDAFLMMLKSEDLRDILRQVSVPVQFVLGDADPICPLAVKGPLEKLLASLRVDVIKGCGHFPFLSRPEKFNALLEGSIKECR